MTDLELQPRGREHSPSTQCLPIELNSLSSTSPLPQEIADGGDASFAGSRTLQSLPPVEGKEAGIFIVGAFLIELTCLGGAFSFSIFQNYFMRSPDSPLKESSNVTISAIGTLILGMSYFAPGLIRPVFSRYPDWKRVGGFLALVLSAGSLACASFMKTPALLVMFLGFLHGTGIGIITTPYIMMLPEWFTTRRGLANGIAFSGAGTGGLIYPFIFSPALDKFGFAWTMRIWALILFIGGGIGLCLVKPRLPTSRPSDTEREHTPRLAWLKEFAYIGTPLWALNAVTTLLASSSLFAVSFYLATYCTSLGLTSAATSGAISAFNAAGLIGEISVGYACDRLAYPLVIFIIGITGTLSTFLLLGFAHSLSTVIIFTLLFGWAAGSWCGTWSASCLDIARLRKIPVDGIMLSCFFVRGFSALIGPIVAAKLYEPDKIRVEIVWGSFGFRSLIEFAGSCMLGVTVLASVMGFARRRIFGKVDSRTSTEP